MGLAFAIPMMVKIVPCGELAFVSKSEDHCDSFCIIQLLKQNQQFLRIQEGIKPTSFLVLSPSESWEMSLFVLLTNEKRQNSCENGSVLRAGGNHKCRDPTFPSSWLLDAYPPLVSSAWAWQGSCCNSEHRQGKSSLLIGFSLTRDAFAQRLECKNKMSV